MLKKFISSVLSIAMVASMLAVFMSATSPSESPSDDVTTTTAQSFTLSRTSATILIGQVISISTSGAPGPVRWSSENRNIVRVNQSGRVQGVSVGTANVYATVGDVTLPVRVTVIAGRITAGVSRLSLQPGETSKVNLNVRLSGSKVVTATSTDDNIAYATWTGAEWDGNNISITIHGVKNGTATIRVHSVNFPEVATEIQVRVGTGTDELVIVPSAPTASVAVGDSLSLRAFTSRANAVTVSSLNTSIATATLGASTSDTTFFTVRGLAPGTATIRLTDRSNARNFAEIRVTVTGTASQYYVAVATRPNTLLSSDRVLQNGRWYMLVPSNYDIAISNTGFARALSSWAYYTVFSERPTNNYNDGIRTFATSVNGRAETRYVLVPRDVDEAQYNTVRAEYTKYWDYYLSYTTYPRENNRSDTVYPYSFQARNGSFKSRYVLLPWNYSQAELDRVVKADKAANGIVEYTQQYMVLNSYPSDIAMGDMVIAWTVASSTSYMVVPASRWDQTVAFTRSLPPSWNTLYNYNATPTNPVIGGTWPPMTTVRIEASGRTNGFIIVRPGDMWNIGGIIVNAVKGNVGSSIQPEMNQQILPVNYQDIDS
ncbi:MAG: Ig-like domain-containing protein [Oscillospiraceae bacterium]|nr:Ig-like domain-containing protein [Oscillospiraceae bacterium]